MSSSNVSNLICLSAAALRQPWRSPRHLHLPPGHRRLCVAPDSWWGDAVASCCLLRTRGRSSTAAAAWSRAKAPRRRRSHPVAQGRAAAAAPAGSGHEASAASQCVICPWSEQAAERGHQEVCRLLLQSCPALCNIANNRLQLPRQLAPPQGGLQELLQPPPSPTLNRKNILASPHVSPISRTV